MSGLESLISVKLPPSKSFCQVPVALCFLLIKDPVFRNKGSSGKMGVVFPFLTYFPSSLYTSILLHFPSCLCAVFPYNSRPTSSLLFVFWQNPHPPRIAPSFTSFSLCLSCSLAQSLNLLEPRDPVCYVNGLNTDTHALTHCMHTHACTYKLSFHHTCTYIHMHANTHSEPNMHSELYGQTWLCSIWQAFNSLPVSTIAH